MELNLPNDADGNVIPLNVKVMYEKDGSVVRVDDMIYLISSKKWRVLSGPLAIEPDRLYLTKPDSLEQLAADLDRLVNDPEMSACTYLNRKWRDCEGCKFENSEFSCAIAFVQDIAARARNLCGDD